MIRLKNRAAKATRFAVTIALSGLIAAVVVTPVLAIKPDVKKEQAPIAQSGNAKGESSSSEKSEFISTMSDSDVPVEEETSKSNSSSVAGDTVAGVQAKKALEAAILNNQAADHYDLGRHYMHKFDWEMAEVELEAAIMCMPTMKAAHRDYCVVSTFRGQPMRSLAEFMMVVGLGEPIPLNDVEKAALVKKAAKLHYQKGINYGTLHEWKKATPEFQCALSYAPTSASIAHSLAFSYAAAGDFEQAESEYLKAFALDPTNSYSHADFAMLLSEHGDQKKAMEQLATAINLSPGVAALHVDMAWLAEANGDLKKAETEFHEAVHLSPKHAGLWSHLGRVEERLGKAKDAKSAYSEALAVDPGDDEAKTRLDALNKSGAPANGAGSGTESAPANHAQDKIAS
jgi:Flp pilus assembly protein TadD